jgi:Ca2+-binding RTX toxin-like protein
MPLPTATEGDDKFFLPEMPLPGARGDALGGWDQLILLNPSLTVVDADFAGFSNLEVLQLRGAGGTVTLGTTAAAAFTGGSTKVVGSGITLNASAYVAGEAVVFVGGAHGLVDTITTGAGNDKVTGNGGADVISTGRGDDKIVFASITDFMDTYSVNGGLGVDTLSFTGVGGTIEDAGFDKFSNLEFIKVEDGAWTLNLGAEAVTAFTGGHVSIVGTAATDSMTINVVAGGPRITATGSDFADVINGGSGADVINGGGKGGSSGGNDTLRGGAGNDTFVFYGSGLDDISFTSGDTIDGGTGYDVIRLLVGGSVNDDAFANVSNIEGISLGTGNYSLTFEDNAKAAFDGNNVRVNAAQATSAFVDATNLGRSGARFSVTGSDGNDFIGIGGNIATMTGGGGADQFLVEKGAFYKATITDFEDGVDKLLMFRSDLPAGLDSDEKVNALLAKITSDTPEGLLINGHAIGLGGTLTLAGMTKAQLDATDFFVLG